MAPKTPPPVLEVPRGWRSKEAASFVAQLDWLSEARFAGMRGISVAELQWQPRPGANTIGMLFVHCAIHEVGWMLIAKGRLADERFTEVLGLDRDATGIPLPPRGRATARLRGRSLAWYRRVHEKARRFVTRTAKTLTPADLSRVIEASPRRDGVRVPVNARWILFHLVKHEAGHLGQMLMLRHEYRDRRRR